MAGLIQNEDIKSEAEIVAAGGTKAQLPNDTKIYITANNINETLDDAIALGKIGGGGSGINYLTDGNFESGTGAWYIFNDGASVTPVDLYGGTITSNYLTITRTTTAGEVLRGIGSGKLSKTANDAQGWGVARAFTIALADVCKPMQFKISYKALDTNFSFGNADLRAWIYDVDNASLIAVTPYQFDGGGYFLGEFQSTTSLNYRVALYVATVNATAWNMAIDDLEIGPVTNRSFGTAGTDWIAFTPTGNFNNTTYYGKYRRVGDSAEITMSAVIASAPSAANFAFILPAFLSIDTAKIATNVRTLGVGFAQCAGTNFNVQPIISGNAFLFLVQQYANTTTHDETLLTNSVPRSFTTGDWIEAKLTIPIVGWSSNIQLNDVYDGRVVACDAYLSSTYYAGPNGSLVTIPFDAVIKDTHAGFSSANKNYTFKISGFYDWNAYINLASGTNVFNARYIIAFNSSRYGVIFAQDITPPANTELGLCGNISSKWCEVGDTVSVQLYGQGDNSASNVTISSTPMWSYFQIKRASGPAYASAGEKVYARYSTAAGTTYTSGGSPFIIDYVTKDTFDSHAAVTTGASWKLIAPRNGVYFVKASIQFSNGAWVAGNPIEIDLYKNGAQSSLLHYSQVEANITTYMTKSGSDIIYLNKDEYIQIVLYYTRTAGDLALNSNSIGNYVDIISVS